MFYQFELLPQALAMGMTESEFWTLNPRKLSIHQKAYDLKLKEQDRLNWYLGQYFISAMACAFDKNTNYIEQPLLNDLGLTQEEIDDREIRKMIEAEEQWIAVEKQNNLPITKA